MLGWVLVSVPVAGCGGEDPSASAVAEDTEVAAIEAAIGDSYDLHVEPKAGTGYAEDAQAVLSVPVEAGAPFAAVMRRQGDDGALDAWLALYVEGERIAVSDHDQGVVPMAAESDAVVVYTPAHDGEVVLVAADRDLSVSADFQLDLVPLDTPTALPLHRTSPATRVVVDALRDRETQMDEYHAAGVVSEGADGFVVAHPEQTADLEMRAAVNSFVAQANEERSILFREIVSMAGVGDDPQLELEAGAVCGALWGALRSDRHALRDP